jgi:hypothetical protein
MYFIFREKNSDQKYIGFTNDFWSLWINLSRLNCPQIRCILSYNFFWEIETKIECAPHFSSFLEALKPLIAHIWCSRWSSDAKGSQSCELRKLPSPLYDIAEFKNTHFPNLIPPWAQDQTDPSPVRPYKTISCRRLCFVLANPPVASQIGK